MRTGTWLGAPITEKVAILYDYTKLDLNSVSAQIYYPPTISLSLYLPITTHQHQLRSTYLTTYSTSISLAGYTYLTPYQPCQVATNSDMLQVTVA